jgi:hexokinase
MSLDTLIDIKNNFISELQNGADGKESSLPFIRHTLASNMLVNVGEIFQTLVIGGSFYQKAVMKRIEGNIQILEYSQGEQPPFLTEEDLLAFVEKHIEPEVKVIAVNFAYPLNPIMRGDIVDGMLVSGSKENTFNGLVGKAIGETIEKHFREKHNRELTVAAANDTICLLLSGLIHHEWNNLAAGIVGTGLNFAIFLDKSNVINLESANFNKFKQSEAGLDIDQKSAQPGDGVYEKEVSGAYLYRHFNYLVKKQNLPMEEIKSTKELESLVRHENKEIAQLAKRILDYSAGLVAALVAAIMEFCKRDIVFIMQGSLYWKGYQYKETVEQLVIQLCPQYRAAYENVLHSDLYGAAKLVA